MTLLEQLTAAKSRDEAKELLAGMTVAQLCDFGRENSIRWSYLRTRKADIVEAIVQSTVGFRLDYEAIGRSIRHV